MTYSTDFRKKVLLVTKFHLVMPIRQAPLGGYLNAPRLSPLVLGKQSLVTSKMEFMAGSLLNDDDLLH
ncbi:hypothetical protein [Beggiatoa leptomitoformis]|uniref:Uncharacterized protein n=1 Tax=Beggiatoa leptomitoformis TaxID=288004 RepID=A0A2N9YBZ0_9GAMM|nr:hypothetical protein [Beggiatoa leptomitoformis]ALG66718.1 hypothetical protein AL038_02010 [Beggiatoa leptomitoformis]AUI67949.1 hypothetical protein BLE401_04030 [Beggiatoa leptomitoformis]